MQLHEGQDWLFVAGIDEFPLTNVNPYQLFNGFHRHVFSLALSLPQRYELLTASPPCCFIVMAVAAAHWAGLTPVKSLQRSAQAFRSQVPPV